MCKGEIVISYHNKKVKEEILDRMKGLFVCITIKEEK